ncbi:MAG: hypothetical protein ACC609_09025 [Methanobacterium formicicum]
MTTHQNYSYHFLDTNVLLDLVIKWNINPKPECRKYMECSSTKYISERVHTESEKVLNRHRKVAFKYLDFFLEEYNSGRLNERNLRGLRRKFLRTYDGQEYPEKTPFRRFHRLVKAIDFYFHDEFVNYLYNPSELTFETLKQTIRKEITDVQDELDDICAQNLTKCPNSYNNTMQMLETHLLGLGLHKPDHLILLDCHCLGNTTLKDNMAFITSDSGIINSKDDIEFKLNNLFIFEPSMNN